MYEFVTALTCVTVLFFVALMMRYRAWHLGVFLTGAVVVALGLAQTIIYTPAGPLVPALRSYWLAIHVAAMTLFVGIFFVAAVLGVVYLFAERYSRRVAAGRSLPGHGIMRRLPGPEELDRLTYRTVVFGFPIWTFGIIAGAIWADQAWGRYWGWDPVQTWAFITWVVYACFLHARATAGWRGKRAAYIQLAGFACLLFNVLVVRPSSPGCTPTRAWADGPSAPPVGASGLLAGPARLARRSAGTRWGRRTARVTQVVARLGAVNGAVQRAQKLRVVVGPQRPGWAGGTARA